MRCILVLLALSAVTVPAIAASPDPAALVLESARQWEAQERPDLARLALEKLLRSQPGHPAASRQLVQLEIRSGRIDAAQKVLEALRLQHPRDPAVPELEAALRLATQDRLRLVTARRLFETRHYDEAAQAMRDLFPQGPPPGDYGLEYWNIISRSRGGLRAARAGLEQMARQYPDDPRYAAAAARLRAQEKKSRPPAPAPDYRALADEAVAAGRTDQALRLLGEAIKRKPPFAWAFFDLARLHQKLGQTADAHRIMDDGVARAPADAEMRYAAALVYSGLDDDAAALASLAAIPASAQTEKTRELQQRLQEAAAKRSLEAARLGAAAVETPPAVREPAPPPVSAPDDRARAAAALAAGHADRARQLLEQAVKRNPVFPWTRFDLAKLYQIQDRPEDARKLMDEGVALAPADAEMRYAAALVYSGLNEDAAALAALAAIPAEAQSLKTRELEARLQESYARHHDGFLAAGMLTQDKPGTAGTSQYSALMLPVELRMPLDSDHYWTIHVDPVSLDAGTLPATYNEAALFGQVQARGPSALANFPSGAPQDAFGTDLGLAYETADWRADVGTTPIGFPVTNLVGGLRWSGDVDVFSGRLALVRRPVTGSVLSYAGARDPASGQVWGGVLRNGFEASLGYYSESPLSGSISSGAYLLTGRHVKDNPHVRVRLAADWKFVDQPSQEVSAGLALMYWHYGENLSQYTFGHGGYYSPQSYLSLALPADWRGRYRRLSYRLRAAVSVSRTHENAEDFYPNDSALQAQARGSPLPAGFTQPVYGASDGGGLGYSFQGTVEYRLSEKWFIGGQFQVERSDFFAPDTFGGYFRYDFDGKPDETPFPPRPPLPYLDY